MRHVMDAAQSDREPIDPSRVDAGVGHHDYPIVISSMSFGSQCEPAFRAYAEAAKAINILCVNGEGGEIRDMYGSYRKWRGQQVASGRFGVSAEMLNSSYLAEIKIGQGAKPGEGGHLPGEEGLREGRRGPQRIRRHRPDLAVQQPRPLLDRGPRRADRRAEDRQPRRARLGQGARWFPTSARSASASPRRAPTSSRSPASRAAPAPPASTPCVTSGLPSDIGTRAVHRALMEAGIRNRVEIWADGGYRHGHDIVKLHCLGANRVGFGTLAMVSLGCTICRGCQLDTCHVGIATQIETVEEAQEQGPEEVHAAGVRARGRDAARASSRRWARRSARSSPRSATSAPRTWSAATSCSCRRATPPSSTWPS